MKIYILTDPEGPAMVSRFEQTREEGPQKQVAMKLLTWEVNAVSESLYPAPISLPPPIRCVPAISSHTPSQSCIYGGYMANTAYLV